MQPQLHPHDIVVALKLSLNPGLTIQKLADSLALSLSAAHRSLTRATAAGLLRGSRQPVRHAIREFVLHGLRHAFPVVRGSMTRGVPTAHAALPLLDLIHADLDPIPVWPDVEGDTRGVALEPLYPTAFGDRGRHNPIASHDLEDMVAVPRRMLTMLLFLKCPSLISHRGSALRGPA